MTRLWRALGWLWPRSLRGRLLVLLLLALVASQAIAVRFFFDERRMAVLAALGAEAVARTANVARLLELAPPELHDSVLASATTPLSRFTLDRDSALDDRTIAAETPLLARRLARALAAELDEPGYRSEPRRVRAALVERERPSAWREWLRRQKRDHDDKRDDEEDDDLEERVERWAEWRERWKEHVRDRHRPPPPNWRLVLSVGLDDGRWLNMETGLRRPPIQWAWPTIMAMALMAVAIVAIVTIGLRRLTRSLDALAGAADRFGRGARDETLPETGPLEVRRVTAAFNAMQSRLSRFVEDRTRLLAAISHDLRTPITSMRIRAELLDDDETKAKLLETLEEMQRMAEATLAFARDEAMEEAARPVDLAALLESVAEDFADMGEEVVYLASDPPLRQVVDCRPTALKRALRNLVENAVRYGARARLSIVAAADGTTLRIDDDGPGLPPDRIEAMFEPFVRLEASRNRETGGVGLGLSIARSIARAHGGDVVLSNRAEGGLRAEIRLPGTPAMV